MTIRKPRRITGSKARPPRSVTGKKSAAVKRPPRPITGQKGRASDATNAQKPISRVSRINLESLLDRKQVSAILGMHRSTIIRNEKLGKLRPIKLNKLRGGRVRYLARDIIRFRDGQQ